MSFETWWKGRYQDGPIYFSDVKFAWNASRAEAEAQIAAFQAERDALKAALEAQHADAVKLRLRLIELGERINITATASGEPARKP